MLTVFTKVVLICFVGLVFWLGFSFFFRGRRHSCWVRLFILFFSNLLKPAMISNLFFVLLLTYCTEVNLASWDNLSFCYFSWLCNFVISLQGFYLVWRCLYSRQLLFFFLSFVSIRLVFIELTRTVFPLTLRMKGYYFSQYFWYSFFP